MKNLRHIECTLIGYFLGINFTYYFSRRSSCCLELFYFQKELYRYIRSCIDLV